MSWYFLNLALPVCLVFYPVVIFFVVIVIECIIFIVSRTMSEMPKTLTIKNKVRALRMESRWSQEDVAAELDVLKQTIAAIEEQRYNPPLELALKFSELFDTPVEEIFQLH